MRQTVCIVLFRGDLVRRAAPHANMMQTIAVIGAPAALKRNDRRHRLRRSGRRSCIAVALAGDGADVGVVGLDTNALAETVAEVQATGRRWSQSPATSSISRRSAASFTASRSRWRGRGSGQQRRAAGRHVRAYVSEELFAKVVDINLKSLYFCCQKKGARRMIDRITGGKLINLGSTFSPMGMGELLRLLRDEGACTCRPTLASEWARHRHQCQRHRGRPPP